MQLQFNTQSLISNKSGAKTAFSVGNGCRVSLEETPRQRMGRAQKYFRNLTLKFVHFVALCPAQDNAFSSYRSKYTVVVWDTSGGSNSQTRRGFDSYNAFVTGSFHWL